MIVVKAILLRDNTEQEINDSNYVYRNYQYLSQCQNSSKFLSS